MPLEALVVIYVLSVLLSEVLKTEHTYKETKKTNKLPYVAIQR